MKRIAIITLAAAGLTLAATPSFAQSSSGGSSGGSFGNSGFGDSSRSTSRSKARAQRKVAAERKRAAKLEAERKALFDAERRAQKSKIVTTSPSSASGANVFKEEKPLLAKPEDVLVNRTVTQLPTNCPAGTIAQSNGTCMLK